MRIALLAYAFQEYSVLHANAMAEDHDVLLLLPKQEANFADIQVSSKVDYRPFDKPRMRQPIHQWFSVRKLMKVIDDFRPDVIHYQQGHLWFNFALPWLRKKYPLVVTVHDPRHHVGDTESKKTPQWVMDFGFRRADQTIVHGSLLADQVHTLFRHPKERIHVIPHVAMGAGVTDFSNLEEEPFNVLFFGRIWDYKGLEYLIQAEPLITEKIPDVKIVIAGTGDDFEKYRSRMVHPERFEILHRWIGDDEQATLFKRAAIVVLPYIEATQSGVVPVAYNYARPVVATNVGALPECVVDEVTGLLVPSRDPSKLADAIVRLLRNADERHKMGRAAKAYLDRESSPKNIAKSTLRVYEQACSQRNDSRLNTVLEQS
jgi:glycosyltransferase involved in cell wall biosynthesis